MKLYRGITKDELKDYNKNGIPPKKNFTTNVFMAKKHGSELIEVNFNPKNFELNSKSNVFTLLKIKEKYFTNKIKIKRFKKLGFIN